MGKTQSKEEVIITQAGNSGGTTAEGNSGHGYSLLEVCGIVTAMLIVAAIIVWCCRRSKKALEKKIRLEVMRSQEQLY